MTRTQDLRAFCKKINDKFVGNFSDNPGAPGGGHAEHEGPGYQQGGGRGFGYNRGGFRGRGGFPVRPGMGRGFDHGPPPGDMGHGGPWMGKETINNLCNNEEMSVKTILLSAKNGFLKACWPSSKVKLSFN